MAHVHSQLSLALVVNQEKELELFLVFLALVVATVSLYVQRQHNRKQMLPLLHIHHSTHAQGGFVNVDFKLINDGQGPAQLKSFTLDMADEKFEITHYKDLIEVFSQYLPDIHDNEVRLSYCIRANSEIVVLSYKLPEGHNDPFAISEMTIKAMSIYEDVITVNNRGFSVESNPRDKVFERAFEPILKLLLKVGSKDN